MNIYEKLIEVRKEVPYLQKENAGSQYKYVSSSQVLSNCKRKMDELGILLIPTVSGHKVSESIIEQHEKDTDHVFKRTTTYFTELDMTMTWVNAEKPEETISCPWYGQGVDIAGEKGVGKAMTYAEKYFMLKFFNIPTDKDDPDSFKDKVEGKEGKKFTRKPADQTRPTPAPTAKPQAPQGTPPTTPPPKGALELITEPQRKKIYAMSLGMKIDTDQMKRMMLARYGKDSSTKLTKAEATQFIDHLSKMEKGEVEEPPGHHGRDDV